MNFVALHRTDEAMTLLKRHPNAFLLLTQIAMRAKYKPCPITKLEVGQAFIGDWKAAGLPSEMAYRHAKLVLSDCKFATFRGTNKGTVATLLNSAIYSITSAPNNDPDPTPATHQQRVTTRTQGNYIPPTPQGGDGEGELPLDDQPTSTTKSEWMPKGWKKWTASKKKRTRVGYNTERQNLIGEALGRKPTTIWTVAETEALLQIKPSDEEIEQILDYYLDETIPPDADYRRRNLETLLNNWAGEIDRARLWKIQKTS